MDKIIHIKPESIEAKHRSEHPKYEFFRRNLVTDREGGQCEIAMYEIPPGKAGFPYHYHVKNEESFYILKGEGLLKTPDGERKVVAGEFLFFPANANGAHMLTNSSQTEMLVYLDFDTHNDLEVAVYPDTGKIGVWGMGINQLHQVENRVRYYDGE